jgi:hypothetical protein
MALVSSSLQRKSLVFLALLTILLTGPATLQAADEVIKVSVVAILATSKDTVVDPKLDSIAQEIQTRLDGKLTGFRLAKMSCKSLKVGDKDTFELVGDQVVTVTVLGNVDKDNKVCVKVAPPLLGEITYMTTCGKFLPIITRYRTKNDELLILAVRVKPCEGKK